MARLKFHGDGRNLQPLDARWRRVADLITRVEAEPGPYGKPPDERPVEEHLRRGVVAVDKPQGPSSHEVAAWVREMLEVDKAGHGGTLDPNVSGVLPVGLATATKVLPLFLSGGKAYVTLMRLHGEVPRRALEKALAKFRGTIEQMPPKRAAVKRRLRTREVYELKLLEVDGRDVLFRVECEAGTYVRKLVHDMGEALTVGAHMEELRRTRAGPLDEDDLVTLHDLRDAYVFWKEDGQEAPIREAVRPLEEVVATLKQVVVRDSAVDAVCHGAGLAVPGVVRLSEGIEAGETVAVMTLEGEAVCTGEAKLSTQQILDRSQGIAVAPDRVLMAPGTYPKGWS